MKQIPVLISLMFSIFILQAQDYKTDIAISSLDGIASVIAGVSGVKYLEEQAEYAATQWVLSNKPTLTSFSLKTMDFDGKKVKDLSTTTLITYEIQEFVPSDNPELNGNRYVLFCFTSAGWINSYGIDLNRIKWVFVDKNEWIDIMVAYVQVSSAEKDYDIIKETLQKGLVVNKGVKVDGDLTIPFYRLSNDMYLVTEYSSEMKLIYNERSLGVFLNETKDLVQIARGTIIQIHVFFLGIE